MEIYSNKELEKNKKLIKVKRKKKRGSKCSRLEQPIVSPENTIDMKGFAQKL